MKSDKPLLGYDKFLMMALYREGPLGLKELNEKSMLFLTLIWYQQLPGKGELLRDRLFFRMAALRSRLEDGRAARATGAVEDEMEKLIEKGLVERNERGQYQLTADGQQSAAVFEQQMDSSAAKVGKRVLAPSATAKNTTILDAFLALVKFSAGLISGSAGLISDGTDAVMDTITAFLVWLGIRFHRETMTTLLVIAGLFIASVSVGYNAVTHLARAFTGDLEPVDMPYLVIAIESFAILAAVFLFYYQRFVGKVNRNLTLVSQSVDSKNHIFIGAAVIIGAIFAIFGINFVDALIGLFIAVGIFKDAVDLLREVISSRRGGTEDYSHYRLPLEECWQSNRLMAFRNWILYVIWAEKLKTRPEIVLSLKGAFRPDNYIPVLSELGAACSEHYDFEGRFEHLVEPLREQKLLIVEGEQYLLTEAGGQHLEDFMNNFKYYDVHTSDEILLAMAEDRKAA